MDTKWTYQLSVIYKLSLSSVLKEIKIHQGCLNPSKELENGWLIRGKNCVYAKLTEISNCCYTRASLLLLFLANAH
jgi:hypothetical protein